MRIPIFLLATLAAFHACSAAASTIVFDSDPFSGTLALTTPGRQIVGGETSISFDVATDQFVFDPNFFAIGNTVSFGNDVIAGLPVSGLNTIVLQTVDDDGNSLTSFAAGNAANLLASHLTAPGAGFFIYFNSGLDVPRLVYSTDLSDQTADLRILARLTNLSGNPGSLAGFGAANFTILSSAVPEPGSWAMILLGFGAMGAALRRRRAAVRLAT